jgi:hypothetical protein
MRPGDASPTWQRRSTQLLSPGRFLTTSRSEAAAYSLFPSNGIETPENLFVDGGVQLHSIHPSTSRQLSFTTKGGQVDETVTSRPHCVISCGLGASSKPCSNPECGVRNLVGRKSNGLVDLERYYCWDSALCERNVINRRARRLVRSARHRYSR